MTDEDKQQEFEPNGFGKDFSESGFWTKAKRYARTAGREVMGKATLLFYAARSDKTPLWAKTVIYSALGYFIHSLDAIPDLTPVVGFADDLGVLVAAIATVAAFISPESKQRAEEKIEQWFGPEEGVFKTDDDNQQK